MSRLRLSATQTLNAALAASLIAKEVGDSFPPAAAAAGVLFLIFDTIKHLQTNQTQCYRLAKRSLDLLVQIKEQMEGRMDTAPPSLLKNLEKFEKTLTSIHEKMRTYIEKSWKSRLLKKGDIEKAIEEFNAQLNDAARSFQISTLINIHYAIGDRTLSTTISSEGGSSLDIASVESPVSFEDGQSALLGSIDDYHLLTRTEQSISTVASSDMVGSSFEIVSANSGSDSPREYGFQRTQSPVASLVSSHSSTSMGTHDSRHSELDDFDVVEDPFVDAGSVDPSSNISTPKDEALIDPNAASITHWREYHQSEIILQGRSKIKDGWWAGTLEVPLEGRIVTIKRYEGEREKALELWRRDLDILKNINHPNLPTLLGHSMQDMPTPFVILSDVKTRALRLFLRDEVKTGSVSSCVDLLVQLYEDTLAAAQYLQALLQLTDSKMQDYVENASYRMTSERRILIGLPPIEVDDMVAYRQWKLSDSVRDVLLQALPVGDSELKKEVQGSFREALINACP